MQRARAHLSAVLGLLMMACTSKSVPPARLHAKGTAAEKRVTFAYRLGETNVDLPVAVGSVRGVRTHVVIDTGASAHMLMAWLARRASLETNHVGRTGIDHLGQKVSLDRAPRPDLRLDGWGTVAPPASILVGDGPPELEQLGIGAFLSPQSLAEDESAIVVLDLPAAELRVEAPDAAGSLLKDADHAGTDLREHPAPCVGEDPLFPALAFVLPALVEDHRVRLLIDTGAPHTELFTTSAAGRALLPTSQEGEPGLVMTGPTHTRRRLGTRLVVGNRALVTELGLVPGEADPTCPCDGVLGMDFLRACTLIFRGKSLALTCRRP